MSTITKSSKSSFWETIELLISVEGRKSEKDKRDEADDWAAGLMRTQSMPSKEVTKPALEHILKSSMRRDSSVSDYSERMHEDEVKKFLSTLDLSKPECK